MLDTTMLDRMQRRAKSEVGNDGSRLPMSTGQLVLMRDLWNAQHSTLQSLPSLSLVSAWLHWIGGQQSYPVAVPSACFYTPRTRRWGSMGLLGVGSISL